MQQLTHAINLRKHDQHKQTHQQLSVRQPDRRKIVCAARRHRSTAQRVAPQHIPALLAHNLRLHPATCQSAS
jgi:hypothetical protein